MYELNTQIISINGRGEEILMRIQPTVMLSNNPSQLKEKKPTEQLSIPTKEEVKQTAKEIVQRHLSEIQEAKMKTGEGDPKSERILTKFNSGKKLSSEELNYLIKNAPASVDRILRITAEREQTERMMHMAKSKTDVQLVVFQASKVIDKSPDPEEKLVRAKHLQDARVEYEKTDEYKEKPNTPLDGENQGKSKKKYESFGESNVQWAAAKLLYEKGKLPH